MRGDRVDMQFFRFHNTGGKRYTSLNDQTEFKLSFTKMWAKREREKKEERKEIQNTTQKQDDIKVKTRVK